MFKINHDHNILIFQLSSIHRKVTVTKWTYCKLNNPSSYYSPNKQIHEKMNSLLVNSSLSQYQHDANVTPLIKKSQIPKLKPRQITYKIKDGLYLATSLDAFRDDEFVLLNWIEHVVVLENHKYPFDNILKVMYGQEDDQIVQQGQEVIRYLHFDEELFSKDIWGKQEKQPEGTSDFQLNQSLIRQLNKSQNQNKLVSSFSTLYNFIQESHTFGSSCLIIPSNPNQDIDDLSCVFSISTAYLMTKYKWSLYKALQFMNSRLKDVNLSQITYEWLNKVEIQLLEQYTLTYNWQSYQSTEELVIRNTFLNAKKIVCDNSLRKLQLNGQITSRQRLKSKPKIQNTVKKPSLTNRTHENLQNIAKPILKQQDSLLTLRSQRKRIEINTGLNQIKQYEIKAQQFEYEQINLNIESKNQNDTDKSFDSSNSSSFLSVSRNKRISLCVSKIVSKYREQHNLSQRNKSKAQNLDKSNDSNTRGMTKKKSFYNFESCKTLANLPNKDLKTNQSQQISKILKKIKIKQTIDSSYEEKTIPIISLTQPSVCNFGQNQTEKTKLKTQNGEEIMNSTKRETKNSPNNLSRKNSLNPKQPINQSTTMFSTSKPLYPTTYRSQQKLRQLKPEISMKSQSILKGDQRKQNSIDKLNSSTKVYIKQIKTQKCSDRRQSMKQNIENIQKHKEKNLMIEYEDFKEMIKKKQKSIGNLVSHHVGQDKVLKERNTNGLSSVLQKLKRDVSEIQMGMNQSNILKKTEPNNSFAKVTTSKTPTLKWR